MAVPTGAIPAKRVKLMDGFTEKSERSDLIYPNFRPKFQRHELEKMHWSPGTRLEDDFYEFTINCSATQLVR